ncbi:MAG TPA: hypothetical protein VN841_05785 [Bryobacteraceae bacterium]|nr:hypothetical protein [Bryobacteraceae bacterium]
MLRLFLAVVLLSSAVLAQNAASPSLDERLSDVGRLLEARSTSEAERLIRQLLPKPEEEPSDGGGIFSTSGFHDVLWAMVGYSYLEAHDYAAAERVAGERLRAAEARGAAAAGHLPIYMSFLAELYRLQGKHAAAYPLYMRLLALDDRLPADFQTRTELGFVECLILRGETATAEMASRPAVDPDGSYVGPSFHEAFFNTHAVAMEEAGHRPEAAEFEAKIDAESRRPPAANQQDRDLLRARLMSARKQNAAAEAIYRKWTAYWKTAGTPGIVDPKESLQIRTTALIAYGHFLSVHGRSREAQAIQAQLVAAGCRFGTCE